MGAVTTFTMATYLIQCLLVSLIISASSLDVPPLRNIAIATAEQEMQQANYFTFVTLLNMVKDKIPSNSTFLMPNDRMLAKVSIPENNVMEFISMHLIPSSMLFDDLMRLPTETMIPTNQPGFMLRVYNRGRKRFYLNNILVSSPNICTAGPTFMCHGINGVLKLKAHNRTTPPFCFHASPPTVAPPPSPALSHSSPPPPIEPPNMAPTTSPPQAELSAGSRISSSPSLLSRGLVTTILSCMILPIMKFSI